MLIVGVAITSIATGAGGSSPSDTRRLAGRDPAPARRKPPRPALLPRGGRALFAGHLVVAYYGIVGTSNVLGRTLRP